MPAFSSYKESRLKSPTMVTTCLLPRLFGQLLLHIVCRRLLSTDKFTIVISSWELKLYHYKGNISITVLLP